MANIKMEHLKEFAGSNTAAVVFVPTTLLIVQMLTVMWWGTLPSAMCLLAAGLVAAAWFFIRRSKEERRRREIGQVTEEDYKPDQIGALVTFVGLGQTQPNADGWNLSALGFLLARLKPQVLHLLATDEVKSRLAPQGWTSFEDGLKKWWPDLKVEIRQVKGEITPQDVDGLVTGILERITEAPVCVDITAGKSTYSVGLYNAAYNAGAVITYIEGGPPSAKGPDNRKLKAIVEPLEPLGSSGSTEDKTQHANPPANPAVLRESDRPEAA